jgi:hypothetical protein
MNELQTALSRLHQIVPIARGWRGVLNITSRYRVELCARPSLRKRISFVVNNAFVKIFPRFLHAHADVSCATNMVNGRLLIARIETFC